MSEYANAENPSIAPEGRGAIGDPFKLKPIPRRLFEGAINAWADTARMPRTLGDQDKFNKINTYKTNDGGTVRSVNNTSEELERAWEEHNPDIATPAAVMASARELGGQEEIIKNHEQIYDSHPHEKYKEMIEGDPNTRGSALVDSLSHHLSSENVPHAKYYANVARGSLGYHRGLVFHVQDDDGSSQIMAVNPTWHTEGAPLFESLEDHESRLSDVDLLYLDVGKHDISSMHRNEIANSNDPESERSMIRQGYPKRRSNAFFKGMNDE